MITTCPKCNKEQTQKPTKEWTYSDTQVKRYLCDCE